MEKQRLANKIHQFFEYRIVKIIFGLLGLVLAYVFASWAIDSGSLLDYAMTLLLLFLGVRDLTQAVFNRK